ncbi:MAG: hypothetical protein M1820_003879 [Bogoriella megaspora]|nr:MAG: hypothetical protein M1820_003879 [Bogoriella megaspora]
MANINFDILPFGKRAFAWLEGHFVGTLKSPRLSTECQNPNDATDDSATYESLDKLEQGQRKQDSTHPVPDTTSRNANPGSNSPGMATQGSSPTLSLKGVRVATLSEDDKQVYALVLTAEILQQLEGNILTSRNVVSLEKEVLSLQRAIDISSSEQNGQFAIESSTEPKLAQLTELLDQYKSEQYSAASAKRFWETAFFDTIGQPLQEHGLLMTDEKTPLASPDEQIPIQLEDEVAEIEADQITEHVAPKQSKNYYANSCFEMNESEMFRCDVRQDLETKRDKVIEREHAIETFGDIYRSNLAEFREAQARGEDVGTLDELDLFHFQLKGQITRELIESEKELRAARQQAFKLGLENEIDDESLFQDNPRDGYGEEMETAMIHYCPVDFISRWIEDISCEAQMVSDGVAQAISFRDDCDDDAMSSISKMDMWDSISCRAPTSQIQRRMRSWQRVEHDTRKQMDESQMEYQDQLRREERCEFQGQFQLDAECPPVEQPCSSEFAEHDESLYESRLEFEDQVEPEDLDDHEEFVYERQLDFDDHLGYEDEPQAAEVGNV